MQIKFETLANVMFRIVHLLKNKSRQHSWDVLLNGNFHVLPKTCFRTLLQNEFNSDVHVAHFNKRLTAVYGVTLHLFYPIRNQYSRNLQQPDLLLDRFAHGGKTRNITFKTISTPVLTLIVGGPGRHVRKSSGVEIAFKPFEKHSRPQCLRVWECLISLLYMRRRALGLDWHLKSLSSNVAIQVARFKALYLLLSRVSLKSTPYKVNAVLTSPYRLWTQLHCI